MYVVVRASNCHSIVHELKYLLNPGDFYISNQSFAFWVVHFSMPLLYFTEKLNFWTNFLNMIYLCVSLNMSDTVT